MIDRDFGHRDSIDAIDCALLLLIECLSYGLRLWTFQYPPSVVFDETYFGNFTNHYINGEYFFDIHPPLAKLIIFGFMKASGYTGDLQFAGGSYNSEDYVMFRLIPITFSSLVPPLVYFALRISFFSRSAAIVAASILLFDTSMMVEGRLVLTDGILHFFTALHILTCAYFMRFRPGTWKWLRLMLATSVSLACAISCKYTALSLCFFVGACELIQVMQMRPSLDRKLFDNVVVRACFICFPAIFSLVLVWGVHFVLLPYWSPDADQLHSNATVVNQSGLWGVRTGSLWFAERIFEVNMRIHHANMWNFRPHPFMTRPIDWPLMTDMGVLMWEEDSRAIGCIGNSVSYVLALVGVLGCLVGVRRKRGVSAVRYAVGWLVSYLPFFLVPRTLFLYHYLIPLIFGALACGAALDLWIRNVTFRRVAVLSSIALLVFGFVCYAPFAYGTVPTQFQKRFWRDVWRQGRPGREAFGQKMADKQKSFDAADALAAEKLLSPAPTPIESIMPSADAIETPVPVPGLEEFMED
jgi:dolichyl-phosphate-mannose--protein O-mannosyl transferase